MNFIIGFVCTVILVMLLAHYVFKKTKFWFFIVMWEFWAGKTQNTTAYMKYKDPNTEINIANYYTGYNDHQLSSHKDLINVLNDIYDYHKAINLWDNRKKLFKFKSKEELEEYEKKALDFRKTYWLLDKDLKFNIVLDECSIYFNPRDFKINFAWENKKLLDFIYQPRKLNVLMFTVVQSPMELDVKFRRLATYYRKYYTGLKFYRWYKDFTFLDPEQIDLDKAEQTWGWIFMGMNLNFYPVFPRYDYDTKELIRPWESIYEKWDIFKTMKNITKINNDRKNKKLFNFKIKK